MLVITGARLGESVDLAQPERLHARHSVGEKGACLLGAGLSDPVWNILLVEQRALETLPPLCDMSKAGGICDSPMTLECTPSLLNWNILASNAAHGRPSGGLA